MRVAFISLLLWGLLSSIQCAAPSKGSGDLGTEDNPYPEGEEGEEEETEEGEDEGDDEASEDEGAADTSPLDHYEDNGAGDQITAEHLKTLHKKFDHDKDGKVHLQEILKFAEQARWAVVRKEIQGVFNEIDSTKDGHLSLEEHMSEIGEFHEGDEAEKALQHKADVAKFKAADLDGDDKLDKEELVHLMHPETKKEVMDIHCAEEMRKRDTNKDGKLSKAEWEVDATQGEHASLKGEEHKPEDDFIALDENKDGFIDMTELRHWESGNYHTEDAMKKLIALVDHDKDHHMTEKEFASAIHKLEDHDAHAHLMDWVFHEEL